MAWVYLVLAGVCEVFWAVGLKKYGFRLSLGSAATAVGMVLSFGLLSAAMKSLPLGTAYAIWTGIGAVGATAVGMAFMGESRDLARITCVGLIVAGIVGLKAFSPAAHDAGEAAGVPAVVVSPGPVAAPTEDHRPDRPADGARPGDA